MVEAVVLDPQLTIYGPPQSVSVQVDIGPTGTRGSKQFIGSTVPSSATIPETPILNDMYLDVSTSYLYQYINDAGTNKWSYVGKFAPFTYNTVSTKTFTSGSASFSFDINTMFGIATTNKDFIISHNIIGTTSVISSVITQPTLSGSTVSFSIKAQSFDGTTWSNLTGSQKVMLSISLAV